MKPKLLLCYCTPCIPDAPQFMKSPYILQADNHGGVLQALCPPASALNLSELLSWRRGLRSVESPRLRGFRLIVEDISSGLKPLSGQDKAPGNMRRADVCDGSEPPHLNPLGPLVLQGHRLDIPTWRKHYWTGAELKSTLFPYTHSNQHRRRTAFIHSAPTFSRFIFLSLSHFFLPRSLSFSPPR
ncbi:hypothetical protein QQF64_017927 [Cirrhinus molitorella]|uniref:Uncharacterized protein n=1 Tax=Cirrhinus molitorella TaxID=172907 RepID=A0ABR3LK09_9TELE